MERTEPSLRIHDGTEWVNVQVRGAVECPCPRCGIACLAEEDLEWFRANGGWQPTLDDMRKCSA